MSTYFNPCLMCGRKSSETALKLDRNNQSVCVNALSCLSKMRQTNEHLYKPGNRMCSSSQRILAYTVADEIGFDLDGWLREELRLKDIFQLSSKGLSVIISALISRQLKVRAA